MMINKKWRVFLSLCFLLIAPMIYAATTEFGIVRAELGREFGLFTGDVIQHDYEIQVPSNMSLSIASLPKPGVLDYWLVLNSADFEILKSDSQIKRYRVRLSFQTFYAPLDVRRLNIPEFQLSFNVDGSEQMQNLTLPTWTFTMSPLKQINAQGVATAEFDATREFMKPDLKPKTIPVNERIALIQILAILTGIVLLLWLILVSGIFKITASPFSQAKRKIKALKKHKSLTEKEQQAALVAVHEAFNQYAGKPLFAHQIDTFLSKHPEFDAHQVEIESFFTLSNQSLFGSKSTALSLDNLLRLCQHLANAEKLGRQA